MRVCVPLLALGLILGALRFLPQAQAQTSPPATPPASDAQNANLLDDAWESAHGFELPSFKFSNLAGWWLFDDQSATDKSAFHLDGTLQNFAGLSLSPPVSPFVTGGLFYGALSFDELAFISFDPLKGPNLPGSFTISAWFKAPAPAQGATPNPSVLAHWTGINGASCELGVDERSAAYLDLTGAAANAVTQRVDRVNAPTVVRDGLWHHLAGVYDAGSATAILYVNGVQEAAGAVSGWAGANAQSFRLGYPGAAVSATPNSPFILDEVRLYNLALGAADIRQLPPTFYDLDGDGLSTLAEMQAGTDPNAADTDGDGIPDGQDPYPLDFYNHVLPILALVSGDGQSGPKGAFLPQPLTVKVTDAAGQALANAPVVFTVASGNDGRLALASGTNSPPAGGAGASVTARTDAGGFARAYLFLPADSTLVTHRVNAAVTITGGENAGVSFGVSSRPTPPVADGLTLWLAADLGVTADANGKVSAWADQSPTAANAAAPSAAAQPRWVGGAFANGLPAVSYDGVASILQMPAGFADFSAGLSAFILFRPTGTAPWTSLFDFGNGDQYDNVRLARYDTSSRLYYQTLIGGGYATYLGVDNTIEQDTFQLFELEQGWPNAGAASIFKNGQLLAQGGAYPIPNVTRQRNLLGAASLRGDFAEVLLYNRALGPVERQQVEAYLAAKYLASPGTVSATSLSPTQVNLFWTGGAGLQQGWSIERKPAGAPDGDFAEVGRLSAAAACAFIDSSTPGLIPGSSYAYRVRAFNANFYSAYADPVTVTLPAVASGARLPADNLVLWLKADAGVTQDAGTGRVLTWTDASGHGNNAVAVDPSRRPQRVDAVLNGQAVLRFDGSTNSLSIPGPVVPSAGNATMLAVVRVPDTSSHGVFVKLGGGPSGFGFGSGDSYLDNPGNNAVGIYEMVRWVSTGQPWGTGPMLAGMSVDGAGTAIFYRNGASLGAFPGNAPLVPNGTSFVGGQPDARMFRGDVAEVLVFDRVLTDMERQTWEAYLNRRYQYAPPPPAPTQLTATPLSATQMTLTWTENFTNVTGYRVERQDVTSGGAFVEVEAVAGGGVRAYLDEGLNPGGTYAYRLRAYNPTGSSIYSDEVTVTLPILSRSPAALPAADDLLVWLRADLGVTKDANNAVNAWIDASGHGYNAASPTSANAPQWNVAAFNGQPALHFDGQNAFLKLPAGFEELAGARGLTALVVARPTSLAPWQRFFDFGNGAGNDNLLLARREGSSRLRYDAITGYYNQVTELDSGEGVIEQDAFQLLEVNHGAAGSGVNLFKNGVQVAQGNAQPLPTGIHRTSNFLGKSNWAGDPLFQGDIAEVLLFDRVLTDAERGAWERYLSVKYRQLFYAGTEDGLDTDGDGIPDMRELRLGTDPRNPDTDGDGMPDGWEIAHGLDPLRNDANEDADGDGLTNLQEYLAGTDPQDYYNGQPPQLTITSGNAQGAAPGTLLAQPLVVQVRAANGQVLVNAPISFTVSQGRGHLTSTAAPSVLATSVLTRTGPDGAASVLFQAPGGYLDSTSLVTAAARNGATTYAQVMFVEASAEGYSTAGDGIPDGWKIAHGLDPLLNVAADDPDGDGLSNLTEYRLGTDPQRLSSGNTGIPDGWVVARGLDPLDPTLGTALDPDGAGLTYLQEYQLEQSRVGWWKFDEGAGLSVSDSSSTANPSGQLVGSPLWVADPDGAAALEFLEGGDYANLGNPASGRFDFPVPASFTVATRFRTTALGHDRLVGKGGESLSASGGYALEVDGGRLAAALGGSGNGATGLAFSTADGFADGQWHHAAIVVDRANQQARLYVDGLVQSLLAADGTPAGSFIDLAPLTSGWLNTGSNLPLTAGAIPAAGAGQPILQQFEGALDEVTLYAKALSGAEAKTAGGKLANAAPVVAMSSPTDGTVLTVGATTTLRATAADADGSIARVEFFLGTTKIGEASQFPYEFAWTVPAGGSGLLTARATDNRGATARSPAITVQVATDSDGDGLPDAWEMQFFGNLDQSAAGSFLGDGVSNLTKFRLGLDPTKPIDPGSAAAVGLSVYTPLH